MPLNQVFFKDLADHIRKEETFEHLKGDLAGMNWFKNLTEADDIVQGVARFFGDEYAQQIQQDLDSNPAMKQLMAEAIQKTIVGTFEEKFKPPKPTSKKPEKQEEIANNMKKLHQGIIGKDEQEYLNENRDLVAKLKDMNDPLQIMQTLNQLHATGLVEVLSPHIPEKYTQEGYGVTFVNMAKTLQLEFVNGFSKALKKANMPGLDEKVSPRARSGSLLLSSSGNAAGSIRSKLVSVKENAQNTVDTIRKNIKRPGTHDD